MSHLTHDEIRGAVEGTLAPAREAHAGACARCAREVEALRAIVAELRAVDVPEPSPLFWEHLSGRVRDAVAHAPAPAVSPWWRPAWPGGLLPAAGAAAALVVIAVVIGLNPPGPTGPAPLPAPAPEAAANPAEPPAAVESSIGRDLPDGEWRFVVAVAEEIELDDAQAEGLTPRLGHSELAVAQLSAEERVELVRLLNEALSHGAG